MPDPGLLSLSFDKDIANVEGLFAGVMLIWPSVQDYLRKAQMRSKHRKNCECCPCHSLFKGHCECWDCCSQLSEITQIIQINPDNPKLSLALIWMPGLDKSKPTTSSWLKRAAIIRHVVLLLYPPAVLGSAPASRAFLTSSTLPSMQFNKICSAAITPQNALLKTRKISNFNPVADEWQSCPILCALQFDTYCSASCQAGLATHSYVMSTSWWIIVLMDSDSEGRPLLLPFTRMHIRARWFWKKSQKVPAFWKMGAVTVIRLSGYIVIPSCAPLTCRCFSLGVEIAKQHLWTLVYK